MAIHDKFDYSKLPAADYKTLGMLNREPKETDLKRGWHIRQWSAVLPIYCCNFCPYDSPNVADTIQHLFLRHWLPAKQTQQIQEPVVIKPLEEQLEEADALLAATLQDLKNSGEITDEDLE